MRSPTLLAALASSAALLALPDAAGAVSVTVTGDDGQPAALTEGTALSIRNMAPVIGQTFGPSEKRYTLQITDPAGQADPLNTTCGKTAEAEATRAVRYTGNGTYTLKFTTFPNEDDIYCEQGAAQTQTFTFTVNAGTKITPPATTLLYRSSGLGFKDPVFTYELNPGAQSYRFYYAFNATLSPANEILGEYGRDDYREIGSGAPPTGSVAINFKHAGTVTMVARAATLSGESPFSAPVVLTIVSPFDFADTPGLKDAKGPSYSAGGKVSEPLAAGSVITMHMAKGKGKFKKVATSKIAADGAFLFKFKQRRKGSYRVRYEYAGSKFMTPGVWSAKLTIKRRFVSLGSLKHVSGD